MKIPTKPKLKNKYKKKVMLDGDTAYNIANAVSSTLSQGMAGAGLAAGGYYAGKAIKGTIRGFKSIGKTMGRKPK